MTQQVVGSGAEATSTVINTISRQAVNIVTASTFPSSPVQGQIVRQTDLNHDMNWQYTGSAWHALPEGIVKRASIVQTGPSIAQSWTTINNSDLGGAFSFNGSSRYMYAANLRVYGDAGTYFKVKLQLDGSDVTGEEGMYLIPSASSAEAARITFTALVAPGAGSHTYRLQGYTTLGGCTVAANTDVWLEHLGTNAV